MRPTVRAIPRRPLLHPWPAASLALAEHCEYARRMRADGSGRYTVAALIGLYDLFKFFVQLPHDIALGMSIPPSASAVTTAYRCSE